MVVVVVHRHLQMELTVEVVAVKVVKRVELMELVKLGKDMMVGQVMLVLPLQEAVVAVEQATRGLMPFYHQQFLARLRRARNGRAASPAPVLQAAGGGLQNNALERLAA